VIEDRIDNRLVCRDTTAFDLAATDRSDPRLGVVVPATVEEVRSASTVEGGQESITIRDYGCLTPGGKLRARPCSVPSALLYESRSSTAQLPCPPDSFTGYVRRNYSFTDSVRVTVRWGRGSGVGSPT